MNKNEKEIFNYIKKRKKIIFDVGSFKGKFTEKIIQIDNNRINTKFYLFDPILMDLHILKIYKLIIKIFFIIALV